MMGKWHLWLMKLYTGVQNICMEGIYMEGPCLRCFLFMFKFNFISEDRLILDVFHTLFSTFHKGEKNK